MNRQRLPFLCFQLFSVVKLLMKQLTKYTRQRMQRVTKARRIKFQLTRWYDMRLVVCLVMVAIVFVFSGSSWVIAASTYTNSVLDENGQLADPHVIQSNGTYYLYPTGDTKSYDVYTSSDLVRSASQFCKTHFENCPLR
jgi:hypothetical protein